MSRYVLLSSVLASLAHRLGARQLGLLLLVATATFVSEAVVASKLTVATEDRGEVDFASQVAPLLSRHCLRCHAAGNQESGISLATAEDFYDADLVIPGQPAESLLYQVITTSGDQPPRMPPAGTPLEADELMLIERWIAAGAEWPAELPLSATAEADSNWWSLQPLAEVSPPEPNGLPAAWRSNPIDRFVFAKLATSGLVTGESVTGDSAATGDSAGGQVPAPPADRRTLLRRLTFDLHGLPPTPAEMQAFLSDTRADAYERVIDRLLASPRYGQRYAQHWLDIAHYADTHGFERDLRRDHAWPYRDYVIDAFNQDKPYARFLQEQIAGDVLWPVDQQAIIATGFLAAGPWDFVGQVETQSPVLRRAARALDLDDMATQVMAATMALTVNCARCHDHKLDPISQREYFQLQAVFAGAERAERIVRPEQLEQYERDRARLRERLQELDSEIALQTGHGVDLADLVGGGQGFGDGVVGAGIDPRTAKVQEVRMGDLDDVRLNQFRASENRFVDGVFIPTGQAAAEQLALAAEAGVVISTTGLRAGRLPVTSGKAWDSIRNGPVNSQYSPSLDGIDFAAAGHSLLGLHANVGITFDLRPIAANWQAGDLRFTAQLGYFGAEGDFRADVRILLDGQPLRVVEQLNRRAGLQSIDLPLPRSARFLTLIVTDGGNGYSHDQVGFGDAQIKPANPPQLSPDQQTRLVELRDSRDVVASQLAELSEPPRFYGVNNLAAAPDVRVLGRGDPESPLGEPLAPAALSALQMLDPQLGTAEMPAGERRAALARWITDPANPLTPRVIVNRLWHWHFGKGLVATPSDFGFGGGRPSHPRLLDWLAGQLAANGGSLKALHRLILTSQTYRQQSYFAAPQEAAQIDAENRLLWRQNSRRLEAEAIRDAVLMVSGKLNEQAGGPGFELFDYEQAYAPIYRYRAGDDPQLWRRSIYRFRVRTTPNPFLSTLDCPDPANLTAARLTTTTPLQSLAMFNNAFMLRQAEYFAARLRAESGDSVDQQVRRGFQLAFARSPTPEELQLSMQFVGRQGLFAFCRSLLNTNEFIYVD
ncbi:DUF1553 domain-containing protein [Planctomycetaceae bacterium SH139]